MTLHPDLRKNGKAPSSAKPRSLAIGQFWKIQQEHVHIVEMGKLLVHYRHFVSKTQKRASLQLMSIAALQDFFKERRARLLKAAPPEFSCL